MSVYSTQELTRKEAIEMLWRVWKNPYKMTNKELEEALFSLVGGEWLENSPCHNYIVRNK